MSKLNEALANQESFVDRHIGPDRTEIASMLAKLGYPSLDKLIDSAVPKNIRLRSPLKLPSALTETAALAKLKILADKNKIFVPT